MFRLIVLYLFIIIVSLIIGELLNIGFGKAAVMTYISAAFIMLMSSIMGRLSYFKYLLLLFIILLGTAAFLKIRKEKRPLKDLMKAFGPSFAIFTLFFFYLYIVMETKALSQVDDTARWAAKVQEALRLDCLYSSTAYSYIRPDLYPPFTTLNEIFFNKMLGGYSDSSSLFGNSSLCFTLLLPFMDRLKWNRKDVLKIVVSLFTALSVLLSINHNPTMNGYVFLFNTTYPDWITGLMIGCGFLEILWFENRFSDYLFFCMLNAALIQTDRICFAFSLLITVTLFFRMLVLKEMERENIRRFVIYVVCIPIILYFGWRFYLSVYAPNLLFHIALPRSDVLSAADVSFRTLMNPVSLNKGITRFQALELAEYQKNILQDYAIYLFKEPIYVHPFNISYIPFNVLVTVILFILNHFNKKDRQLSVVAAFYFLGSMAYAFVVGYTYMFNFNYEEAITLAVYGRYMQSYTVSGIMLLLYALLSYVKHWSGFAVALLLGISFIEPLSVETAVPTPDQEYYRQNERVVIKNYVDRQYNYEPTVVVDSFDISYYYLIRNIYGEKAANLSLFHNTQNQTYENFLDMCSKSDYILIGDYNDDFVNNYWNRLSDTACYNSTLYRIIHDGDDFRFEMLYGFEAMAKESGQ